MAELPRLGVIQDQYGKTKLQVIAIGYEAVSVLKTYARTSSALFLRDATGASFTPYAISGSSIPLNYIIRPDGKVCNGVQGTYNETTIKSWIDASLLGVEEENAAKVGIPNLVFSTNPFKVRTEIRARGIEGVGLLQIHDLTGRLVKSFSITSNSAITWDRKGAPAGMYFCTLNAGTVKVTEKLIVLE